MKKISILLAAGSFAFILSCGSKKQAGEEYYDPNYKPQARTSTADAPADNQQPEGNAPVDTSVASGATAKPTGSEDPKKDEAVVGAVPKDKLKPSPAGADYSKGKNLIAKSDCLSCHKDDTKLLGPAYVDVAKKYKPTEANIAKLANKIIKGGAGEWGQIPMSPHPDLPQADAREMVKYILSLSK